MKILITGASGFVGSRLMEKWPNKEELVGVSLQESDVESINWQNIETVIHLAGLAHQMNPVPDEQFFKINEHLTIQLANQAKTEGVKHFIFMSTIKVYGDKVTHMDESTPCTPDDAYGQSKLNAENGLLKLAGMDFRISILRSPLVVGSGAKGNLHKLMGLLQRRISLPLAAIDNKRSMISLDNLVDTLNHLTLNPIGGVFLAAEPEPISTTDLAKMIRLEFGFSSPLLFSIPHPMRFLIRKIKPAQYDRLFGSSVIDNSQTLEKLKYKNPYPLSQGIAEMVQNFRSKK